MDGPAILTVNFTNWITILVMVGVGFAVLGLVRSGIKKATSNA